MAVGFDWGAGRQYVLNISVSENRNCLETSLRPGRTPSSTWAADPAAEGFRRHTQLLGARSHRRPFAREVLAVIHDHLHRPLTHLG
jgi:hypothetical protein